MPTCGIPLVCLPLIFRDAALQVLPMRTHPMMMMNATGGYMFTATKVISSKHPEVFC